MSTEPAEEWEPEPSPFDPDEEPVIARRPWKPALPMTQADLDFYGSLSWDARTYNPWQCMWNLASEDGIGYMSGLPREQCPVRLSDPTKVRYCLEHAKKMGVDYYTPGELAEATDKETKANLTRLVPKATRVLELVMDDEDAPQGVRAKAASEVLDRTGYQKGIDVRVDARVATVDVTGILNERLDALRDAHIDREAMLRAAIEGTVVPGPEPGGDAYRSGGIDGSVDAVDGTGGGDEEPEGGSANTVSGETIDDSDRDARSDDSDGEPSDR